MDFRKPDFACTNVGARSERSEEEPLVVYFSRDKRSNNRASATASAEAIWRSIAIIVKVGRKRRNGPIYHRFELLYRFAALRAILKVFRERCLLVRGQLT